MATYRMSPSERRATTLRRRRTSYPKVEYTPPQIEDSLSEEEKLAKERQSQGFLTRSVATIGDIVGNILTGASKGLEGIFDFGAGIVGAVGGIFDKGFQDDVKSFISNDWTTENIGNPLQELTKYSYTNDGKVGEIIEGIASGVGQMLPSVAVSIATGGAGAASMLTFMGSAAGNSTEEAFNEGANYYSGLGYGTASGIVEGGIEAISGGIGGTQAGKVLGKQLGKTALGKAGITFVGEGLEEVASDIINPGLKRLTGVDKEATVDWGQLPETFAVGGGVGLAMGGAYKAGRNIKNKNRGGANATNADDTLEYVKDSVDGLAQSERKKGTMTETKQAEFDGLKREMLNRASGYLMKMTDTQRAEYIKSLERSPYKYMFNEDGSVNFDTTQSSQYNAEAYSASIRGAENRTLYKPVSSDTVLSEGIKTTKKAIEDVLGDNANVVITNELGTQTVDGKTYINEGGFSVEGNVIYLNAEQEFESDSVAKILAVHEITHSLEGTKQYDELVKVLTKHSVAEGDFGRVMGKVEKAYNNSTISEGKQQYINATEFVASYAGELLGNQNTIDRLAQRNMPLFERILSTLKGLGKKSKGEVGKSLNTIIKKYEKALDNSIGGVKLSAVDEDKEESIDNSNEIRYNKNGGNEYERTDEFRRVQEASKKLSVEEVQAFHDGSRAVDERIRANIRKGFRRELERRSKGHGDGYGLLEQYTNDETGHTFSIQRIDGDLFYDMFSVVHNYLKRGDQVDVYKREDYETYDCYISEDGLAGIVFTKSGDTISGYNFSGHKSFFSTIAEFVKKQSKTGDCFLTKLQNLPGYYEKAFGWKTASIMDFNYELLAKERGKEYADYFVKTYGESPVYFMVNTERDVETKHFLKDQYEEAVQYQKSFVENTNDTSFSISATDSNGNALTESQQEYFKDSKVIDKDGNLLRVYHGTPTAGFTMFDTSRSGFAWFSPSLNYAKFYTEQGKEAPMDKIYECYLNIKTILNLGNIDGKILDNGKFTPAFEKLAKRVTLTVEELHKIDKEATRLHEIVSTPKFAKIIEELGYDGIRAWESGFTTFAIINPEQAKLTTNKKPTSNPDIRFSRKIDLTQLETPAIEITVSEIDKQYIASMSDKERTSYFRDYLVLHYLGQEFILSDGIRATVDKGDISKYTETKHIPKLETAFDLKGVVESAVFDERVKIEHNKFDEMCYYIASFSINGTHYGAVVNVGKNRFNGKYHIYDVNQFTDIKKEGWDKIVRPKSGEQRVSQPSNIDYAQNSEKVNTLTEKNSELDQEYLTAVENGDMETAQKMVDEAAKRAGMYSENGKPLLVYHATNNYEEKHTWNKEHNWYDTERAQFTVFKKQYDEQVGHFFGKDINNAGGYGNIIYETYLKLTNPLIIHCNGLSYNNIVYNSQTMDTYDWATYAKKNGYDGVIFKNIRDGVDYGAMQETTDEYVVFRSSQIKSADPVTYDDDGKVIPLSKRFDTTNKDIRFSLGRPNLSVSQKHYTLKEVGKMVDDVVGEMSYGNEYTQIEGRTTVAKKLWELLNNTENKELAAEKIADIIIDRTLLVDAYNEEAFPSYLQTLDILSPFTHAIDLSGIKADIEARYGESEAIFAQWHKENGKGVDVATQQAGYEGEPIEQFFAMVDDYAKAQEGVQSVLDSEKRKLPESDKRKVRKHIVELIKQLAKNGGKPTVMQEIIDYQENEIRKLLAEVKDIRKRNRLENALLEKAQSIKDWKKGRFVNANTFKTKIFDNSIGRLARIKNRGGNLNIGRLTRTKNGDNLHITGTRKLFAGLREWYTKDNPILTVGENGLFNEHIAYLINAVAENQKPLTEEQIKLLDEVSKMAGRDTNLAEWYTKKNLKGNYSAQTKAFLIEYESPTKFSLEELQAINDILGYLNNLIRTYNTVNRNGKLQEAKPLAEEYIGKMQQNKTVKVGWLAKLFGNVFDNKNGSYFEKFGDTASVVRAKDKYDSNGFFTETYEDLRHGTVKARIMQMNLRNDLEAFYKKNKKFTKKLTEETVEFDGHKIPLDVAISLYMTHGRDHALSGLALSGYCYDDGETVVRVKGFAKEESSLEDFKAEANARRGQLWKLFSEDVREYIRIAEKIFEQCKDIKSETDVRIMGYTNTIDSYYYPIQRAYNAKNIESLSYKDEMQFTSNLAFNKDTVTGAKGELRINSASGVIERHIRGISLYANIAIPVNNFNTLFNLNVSGNVNVPITVRTINDTTGTWKGAEQFFLKLIADIEGVSVKGSSKIFGKLRKGYVVSVLAANPKVCVTQLSSYLAAGSILDYSSLVKGMGISGEDVDKYCKLAKLRNADSTAVKAQGVLDNVGKVGEVLMKPIGWSDRFVIQRLFAACQVQAQSEGLKLGTEENKVRAGEILTTIILETQQNSIVTERSQAMRSESELDRLLTIFTSDAMKVMGRVIDGFGEVAVLKTKMKMDGANKVELEKQLAKAKKKMAKSVASLVSVGLFIALVAELFKFLYNKDEEPFEGFATDAVGNLIGGLPLIKYIYASLVDGYDIDNLSYSGINNLLSAIRSIMDWDSSKPSLKAKNFLFSAGQILGIPVRNLYNTVYGLTKRFSPEAAYKFDSNFYNKGYSSDLKKAIESGDDDMVATIAGIMIGERVGAFTDSAVQDEMNSLICAGYDGILPRSIGDSITYEGETVSLSQAQRGRFKEIYAGANEDVVALIKSAKYREATEEAKAEAIKFLYNLYYNLAVDEIMGVESTNKNVLFAEAIDVEKLALIISMARSLQADTDKNGKVINGTKKRKIQAYINSLRLSAAQKYMIMGYLGYSNLNGESNVKSYINKLNLSKEEKATLMGYSGYAS